MVLFSLKSALLLLLTTSVASKNISGRAPHDHRDLKGAKGAKSAKSGIRNLRLTVYNLTFMQPFSPFFVMVHSSAAAPLYRITEQASGQLGALAESGARQPLIDYYSCVPGSTGVKSATSSVNGIAPGESMTIDVELDNVHNLVTIASMAIKTNDCFVSLNGVPATAGDVYNQPGLDSGTERNSQRCTDIPGCGAENTNAQATGAENFVHIHRGVHGVTTDGLRDASDDWRNPMMRVVITSI